MTTILTDAGAVTTTADTATGLWLSASEAERITGWTLKPEGMCRGDVCVPLQAASVRDDHVDVEAFWRKLGAPVARTESGDAWMLGTSAQERNAVLAGGVAPDITLPDLNGVPHTLSSLRGRKVFLVTWASW